MVLANGDINIIADMEGTTGVKLHNNRQKLRARFDIIRKLGQGTYGKVQLAVNKDTGEEVAIKTIKKSKIETEQDLVRIQREIQIMSSVQHAHIIHIYEVFENREKIVLVMEYANGGELYDYLSFKKVLTEAEARRVFRQVVAAVFYCHKNMICHRDLKLENILLDERGNAKIADFGLSNIFDDRNFLHTFCGSPLYASPEIVKGTPYFGPEVDCWSLGVLLYTLVYGAMPFDGSNFKRLVKQISEGDYYEPKVPSEASGLIRHMLTVEPSKRATVDDICCHVWVNVGEEVPLMDISQEMCRQMPVRLDYLLALSAAAAGATADGLPSPPPPDGATTTVDPTAAEVVPATPATGESVPEEDDNSQWERPALQAAASDNELPTTTATAAKKHKMAPSTSAVLLNSSSHKVVTKKRKEDEKQDGGTSDDAPPDDDKGGAGEKIVPAESPPQGSCDDTEMRSAEVDKKEDSSTTEAIQEAATDETNKEKTESENKSTQEKSSTDKTATSVKRKTSVNKKSASTAAAASGATAAKPENAPTENTGVAAKPVNKVSKFRKSVSVGKESNGSASPSTPPTDGSAVGVAAAAAQTPPTPPAGTEKRKTSLSSWSRIADARKAFERRSPEKKPAFLPGSKVNSVRKSFESPPSTPEGTSPSIKGVARPFGSSVERKGSMTNSTTAAAASIKKNDDKKNGAVTESAQPTTSQETDQDKKTTGAPLTKQPSKTNARTNSPTKGVRPNDKSTDGGLHHRGCVPSEARAAAAAAQEAKKISPPKSLVRKNSLSKTGSGFSKSPSKEMKATVTTPPPATAGRSTSAVRPRSPTKTMKSSASNLAGKVAPSTSATKVQTDTKTTDSPAEENLVTTTTETVEQPTEPTGELVVVPSREKRGSIEIAPLPSSALVRRYPEADDDNLEVAGPQLRFAPRNKGNFTLLGVKSEVVFDVDNDGTQLTIEDVTSAQPDTVATPPPKMIKGKQEPANTDVVVAAHRTDTREAASSSESDSKIIRYIATVRKHGSSGECGATGEETGPERVTLLKLRCSSSSNDGFAEESKSSESPGTPESAKQIRSVVGGSKSPSIKISMKLGEHQTQVEVNTGVEQRGYNVYRSKYHSVQKYRSIIERRDGEESAEHEEFHEVKESSGTAAAAATTAATLTREQPPPVERSDSFSSTGSNDDLEDVFESLTSESLFTSLLSRTRNLIHRLSDGGNGSDSAGHGRFLRSEMMRRPAAMTGMLASTGGGGRGGFQMPSPLSSFAINSPTLSFRMNVTPRSSYATEHPTTYRNNGSTSSLRSATSGDYRVSEEPGSDYARENVDSRSARRFRYSRSTTRSGGEEDEDDNIAARIRSTNASVTSSRVSFSNYTGSRSTSVNSQLSGDGRERQSRFDATQSPSVQQRDGARSDIISALMRHRNRSLDNRDRPQSYYEGGSTPSSRDWTPTSSFSSMRSPSSAYAQQQQQQQQQQSSVQSTRPRGFQESPREEPPDLYGSRRAGGRYQRYSKSVTKELAEEYNSEESGSLLRPRSLLVLSDLSADEAGSSAAVSPSEESTAAASSVSRDYSKSVSQEDGMRHEQEVESEHKHRITQLTNGTVTSTVRRETKRSVSQTEDGSDGTASAGSATPTGLPPRLSKKMSGDDLPRTDSGIGSLHDGGLSGPATPTATGSSSRRGILKFARSVSSELESLEEEINRVGGSRVGRNEQSAPPDGAIPDLSKRRTSGEAAQGDSGGQGDTGSATPVSDSAETGSVCSDTASTDAGPYSQSRGSEEESVGERIRRKSFFARFNDTRTPRKSRKISATNLPSVAALRSELGRSSSFRHHIFESDSPLGGSGGGSSHRSYFDPTADFFSPPPLTRRSSGGNGTGGGSGGGGSAPHHQRWSMHFGSNADGSSFDPNEYLYGGAADMGIPPLPRRGSQTSYAARTANSQEGSSWNGDEYDQAASLNRTHSLPEEDCPPRPVFRQHSMPGGTDGSGNPAETEGAEDAAATPGAARRRPDRLNLYPNTPRGGGGQSAISPSEDGSDDGSAPGPTRRNVAGSPPGGRRGPSRPGRLDPLDAWDGVGLHGRAGHSLASLMDSLESPSEVLQKAMDLCDSLRFS